MKFNTTRFGTVEAHDDSVIRFPLGLLGLPNSRRFVILDGPQGTPFKWLQSVDEDWLAFVIVDPLLIKPDYQVDIHEEDLTLLELRDPQQGVVAVICSIPGDIQSMTVNLMGPLIFNIDRKLGKQIILTDIEYTTKYAVFPQGASPDDVPHAADDQTIGEGV